MRIVRHLVVVALTLLALLAVSQIVAAQIFPSPLENARVARPQAAWLPFTRTVTITIDAGPVLATALSSYWQTSISDFSTIGRDTWLVALPSDATDVTATIAGGVTYQIGNTIYFSFTGSVADFGWSYRTNQAALRQGNQYRIDHYASINQDRPVVSIGTVLFSSSLQYVCHIGSEPVAITNSFGQWE